MATNPKEFRLSMDQRRELARLSEATGKSWSELFEDLVQNYQQKLDLPELNPRNRLAEWPSRAGNLLMPISREDLYRDVG